MNKLPTKQIYLLAIIIVGIIALSVYSTYALFTFESSTSDIVSIHTPKSLTISENVYEYQQLVVEPNTITTTDIDIYNTFGYDVCYSIWYKVIGDNINSNNVQIFELSEENLTASGVLTQKDSIRVTIAIINDNEEPAKINLGTIGATNQDGSCSLNLADDKNQITSSYKKLEELSEILLKEKDIVKEEKSNYITYIDETEIITYKDSDKIYLSNKFTYDNEMFTLEEPTELTIEELYNQKQLLNENIYFCKENDKCSILYKINEIEKEERIIEEPTENNDETNEEEIKKEIYYHITKYNKLIGYMEGKNGLRKINENDYVFYGDNPNNYIYFNCETDNTSTCELWRIIGLFYNQETEEYNIKIIKNKSIGKYQLDNNNEKTTLIWNNSTLSKYLNEEYKFKNNYEIYIDEYKQNIETLVSLDEQIKQEENSELSKVNILSLSDYINASSCEFEKINEYTEECLTNNYLNNIEITNEWTLTLKEQEEQTYEENETNEETEEQTNEITSEETIEDDEEKTNYAYGIGNTITEKEITNLLDVRPIVYLKSRILIVDGEGTFLSPYVIK